MNEWTNEWKNEWKNEWIPFLTCLTLWLAALPQFANWDTSVRCSNIRFLLIRITRIHVRNSAKRTRHFAFVKPTLSCVLRYVAIVKNPLSYDPTITRRVKLLTGLLLWTLPAAAAAISLVQVGKFPYNPHTYVCEQDWEDQKGAAGTLDAFMATAGFVVPVVVIVAFNTAVLKTARQQSKNVRVYNPQQHPPVQRKRLKNVVAEHRAAIDVSIIVGVTLLCYIPIWVTGLSRRFLGDVEVPSTVYMITSGIFMSSAVWNPFIFSIRRREFRKALYSVVRCRRNSSTGVQGASHSRTPSAPRVTNKTCPAWSRRASNP